MTPGRLLSLAVSAAVLLSCSRPESVERFIRAEKSDAGNYSFTVDVEDSLASYGFWFYSRVDGPSVTGLRLDVNWTSPDGDTMAETVYMQDIGRNGSREPYRSWTVFPHPGEWKLDVRPCDPPKGFRGLGLIYKIQTDR